MNPDAPVTRGTAENPDVYFQHREASNKFYLNVPDVVEHYMNEINKLAGTNYQLFNYHGAPDATDVIVTMGSSAQVVQSTVDYLNKLGRKSWFHQRSLVPSIRNRSFVESTSSNCRTHCSS